MAVFIDVSYSRVSGDLPLRRPPLVWKDEQGVADVKT